MQMQGITKVGWESLGNEMFETSTIKLMKNYDMRPSMVTGFIH